MKLKPLLFSIHRWLGIGMCLLFALWFASGIVMMYVDYPELTESERIANLPVLDMSKVQLSPQQAAEPFSRGSSFSGLTLSTVLGRPSYRYLNGAEISAVVFADNGQQFEGLDAESAVAAAIQSGFYKSDSTPLYDKQIDVDQWSVSAALDSSRPLHRVRMNDEAGTVVYISDKSGQIVRDTNRNERFWNWLGSTIHWIYPVQLRKNVDLWVQVIIVLSLIGIVSVLSGGIIGFMRLRVRKPFRGSDLSPYGGVMKWHHVFGLFSLVFVSTFIFSGLMSMGPWGIFDSPTSPQAQIAGYTGGAELKLSELPQPATNTLYQNIREVEWHKISNVHYMVNTNSNGGQFVDFGKSAAENQSMALLTKVAEAIPNLLPDSRLQSVDFIQSYDDYYYSTHNRYRPLPIYRAKFNDAESTWYHINLTTGEIVNRLTSATRLERWIFNGMHSLDFQFLLQRRPLWDIIVIFLSLVGLGFSITSIVIAWRRLVR